MVANQYQLALSVDDVVRAVGGWHHDRRPLAEGLAAALTAAIRRGDLPAGWRLPPERDLAAALVVSRNTVAAAYRRLATQSLARRQQGSGTWIEPGPADASSPAKLPGLDGHKLSLLGLGGDPAQIDLASATPAALPALEPLLRSGGRQDLLRHHGLWPLGYPPLRQAVAELLRRRGVPTTEGEVLITSGAQQAIALTALGLCRAGELVAIEDPTFPGAIDAYHRIGARLLPVPTDTTPVIGAYAAALKTAAVRLLYVMPTLHNPTGRTLSQDQRRQLVRSAREHNVMLVEDEALADLTFGTPPPPLAAIADPGSIITIGSLSKVYWGGLRVGWLRAARPLIERLGRLKVVLDLGCAAPSQWLAVELLQRHEELRARRIAEMRSRVRLLLDLLAHHVGDRKSVV